MGDIEVVRVQDRAARKAFLDLPYRLYRGDPLWAPPLRAAQKELFDPARHPFYANADAEFLLAQRGGRTTGRVAAFIDRNFNRLHGEETGSFGFFECEDDPAAAAALLDAAYRWTSARGATQFLGPFNPSTNYDCGLLVEGFDLPPAIMMPYNPPFYAGLIEGAGLRKARDLYAYTGSADTVAGEKAERVADHVLRAKGVRIRPIDKRNFAADVEKVWEVYNAAWSRNWGYVPMTREEFLHSAREMKQILDPQLVLLGEAGGRVVGFCLALPDVNDALRRMNGRLFPFGLFKMLYYVRRITNWRVLALGVVEEYRTAGIAAAFYATLIRNARRLGYRNCEMSWILEDNVMMNRTLAALGTRRYKTYRIYERE